MKSKLLKTKLKNIVDQKNELITKIYDGLPINITDVHDSVDNWHEHLRPYITDVGKKTNELLNQNGNIILEGKVDLSKNTIFFLIINGQNYSIKL